MRVRLRHFFEFYTIYDVNVTESNSSFAFVSIEFWKPLSLRVRALPAQPR
jgi:hypothetical protein